MNFLLETGAEAIGNLTKEFFHKLGEALSSFTFFDALDILFLSVLFFFAFRFFRGRKAGAVFIGIVVCLAIVILAFVLGLDGTYYIFSGLFKIGALALVIIFQPEIRDVLQKLGTGSLNGIFGLSEQKKKKQMYYRAVDAICSAVSDLSRTKTGALIALARNTSLEDAIQSGITINADVNSYLLRNIFFNKAPLHDGAVVIDEGRIVAAACLLPLTRMTGIDGDLGTRHRAAIGMSESSDAIIIVVSEETGIISVAYDCTLTRNYTQDSLRNFLLKTWIRENIDTQSERGNK